MPLLLVLGLFAAAAPQAASAQAAVYRCGADGRSYSQQPCADGRPLRVDDDARTPSQRQQATESARRDAHLADALARERRQAESVSVRATSLSAPSPKDGALRASAGKPNQKKRRHAKSQVSQGDDGSGEFKATAPAPPRAKKKSRAGTAARSTR
ncbi:hypothetical protein [Methylibium sp.]|uniref:hypothetical protein n=1 Tax=Methylibium sp. TaxID=2067992 RepID=UPI003341FF06